MRNTTSSRRIVLFILGSMGFEQAIAPMAPRVDRGTLALSSKIGIVMPIGSSMASETEEWNTWVPVFSYLVPGRRLQSLGRYYF
jgi:hypothetical protein